MVKSGLVDRVDVSQIRLAVHLVTACIFLAAVVWTVRSLSEHTAGTLDRGYWQGGALVIFILVQIFVGGLVAGLDAGMGYNTWPLMNGAFVPDGLWAASPLISNLTDNALTVQFFHRITAYLLWGGVFFHLVWLLTNAFGTAHATRGSIVVCIGYSTGPHRDRYIGSASAV